MEQTKKAKKKKKKKENLLPGLQSSTLTSIQHENEIYCLAFDCVDHNKLWKILKEMGIPDHLICLLRNLYAGQTFSGLQNHCRW